MISECCKIPNKMMYKVKANSLKIRLVNFGGRVEDHFMKYRKEDRIALRIHDIVLKTWC